MAMRRYVDPRGRFWMVWNVSPRFTPERSQKDRRVSGVAGFTPERRRVERRGQEPRPKWINGWLCFETSQEKRRLAPIPSDWESCPAEELDRYRRLAAITESTW